MRRLGPVRQRDHKSQPRDFVPTGCFAGLGEAPSPRTDSPVAGKEPKHCCTVLALLVVAAGHHVLGRDHILVAWVVAGTEIHAVADIQRFAAAVAVEATSHH